MLIRIFFFKRLPRHTPFHRYKSTWTQTLPTTQLFNWPGAVKWLGEVGAIYPATEDRLYEGCDINHRGYFHGSPRRFQPLRPRYFPTEDSSWPWINQWLMILNHLHQQETWSSTSYHFSCSMQARQNPTNQMQNAWAMRRYFDPQSGSYRRGTATREMGDGLNFAYLPGGRWEMVGVIGRREAGGVRSPRNPKGDGGFCKNWSVSQW